jgi:inner membrane transporter RhtA
MLLLLAIVSIQLGSALAITLFPVYGPLGMLFLRQALGGVSLCLLYWAGLAGALRQAPFGILLLGLAMSVQSATFYEALARIPLGIAVSIEFLGPLAVALLTSRRLVDMLCVLLAAGGILLLTPAIGANLDPVGVAFAFAAGAGWACFILVSRRLGQLVEGGVGLAMAMPSPACSCPPSQALRLCAMPRLIRRRSPRSPASPCSRQRSRCCSNSSRCVRCRLGATASWSRLSRSSRR